MRALKLRWLFLLAMVFHSTATVGAPQRELYLIDAHSQIDETVDIDKVISLMDQAGIQCVILTTVGQLRQADLVRFSNQYPDRIIPSVRTKLPGYLNNDGSFQVALRRQVVSGNFKAMSELLMYHARKDRGAKEQKAPEIIVYPNDDRVQSSLRYAEQKGWPFVVHIEFASRTIRDRRQFMEQLEAMLNAHPDHPFTMAHMGQLSAAEVRRLIAGHPNLYFQTSRADPFTRKGSSEPWINMFSGDVFAPEWRELVIQYPDRFILAFDNVWPENWSSEYVKDAQYWRKALAELPVDVAHAVAHGNAERLWKISSKDIVR